MMTIAQIKQAANACQEAYLDEEIKTELEVGYSAFFDMKGSSIAYEDVEVANIKTVTHRNGFGETGLTWRKAVEKLHGTNWDSRVLGYFQRSLRDVNFPAPGSLEPLKLARYGSIYHVECGVHRTIAGKAWLAHTYGIKARFSDCYVRQIVLNEKIRAFLEKHKQAGLKLFKTNLYSEHNVWIEDEVPHHLVKVDGKLFSWYLLSGDICNVTSFWRISPVNWWRILRGTLLSISKPSFPIDAEMIKALLK